MFGTQRRLPGRPCAWFAFIALLVPIALWAPTASAHYLDDPAAFDIAVSILRSKVGDHARVLKIEIDRNGIAVEAQDPNARRHIDRWRYGTVTYLNSISIKRLTGPEAVDPTLINPDLEANLFDLESVDLSATAKVIQSALARAALDDPAAVTRIEIQRQLFILPNPSSGDVRWTLSVDSGRERATIYASARGTITGADLSGTRRARTLNIVENLALAAEAATAFRVNGSAEPVLTKISIEPKIVTFSTNLRDSGMAQLGVTFPAFTTFTWDLNGLQRRLPRIEVGLDSATTASFKVDDIDWTIIGKLARDSLVRAALPNAKIVSLAVAKSSEQPGLPVLAWTVELVEPTGERTKVIADLKGVIARVVLPEGRRPKLNWLDAGTMASAIARVSGTFGRDAKIASLVFEEGGGRITVDDPANGGRPATYDFSQDTVARASISFSLDAMGPRFAVSDLAALDEKKLAGIENEAMRRLAGNGPAYLESLTIGAHPFVRKAGAHAIEVRLRDRVQDSVQAHYAWIVFDFDGRPLDFVKF